MLYIILALIFVAASIFAGYFLQSTKNASVGNFPPSPKGIVHKYSRAHKAEDSFLGHLSFFKRMPNTLHQVLFEEMRINHGPLVHLRLVKQHMYIVSDPQLINQVLKVVLLVSKVYNLKGRLLPLSPSLLDAHHW
jgi:hypothetical protein